MKLDIWQVRLCVQALEAGVAARRGPERTGRLRTERGRPATAEVDVARGLERKALEAMAAALESGESLEVGP